MRVKPLLPLLALAVALPVASSIAAPPVEPQVLTYEIQMSRSDNDGKVSTRFTTKVYVVQHRGTRLQVAIFGSEGEGKDGLFAGAFPLCTIVTQRNGTSEPGLTTQTRGPSVARDIFMPLLAHGVPVERRNQASEGTDSTSLDNIFDVVPLTYRSQPIEGKDGQFEFKSQLVAPVPVAIGSMQMELMTLDRTLIFEADNPYPLEGKWERVQKLTSRSVTITTTTLTARRLSAQPLADKDAKSVIAELEMYDALLDDIGTGTLKSLGSAQKKITSYRKKHKDGMLMAAADATDKLLVQRLLIVRKSMDPKAERAKLKGKPAPDFELVDLNGKKHNLAAYRGKIVLLNFYGIG